MAAIFGVDVATRASNDCASEDDNSEDDATYEYASADEEPDEEYASGSDEDADFFEPNIDSEDRRNWYITDGLEPAFADTRFNEVRYIVRQLMYYLDRFEAGKTAHATFETIWCIFGKEDLVPYGFDEEEVSLFVERDPWAITKGELHRLLGHAQRGGKGQLPSGMEDFEKAIAYAPDALPDRIPIDPNDPPEPY